MILLDFETKSRLSNVHRQTKYRKMQRNIDGKGLKQKNTLRLLSDGLENQIDIRMYLSLKLLRSFIEI